jgi:hypothetical protein
MGLTLKYIISYSKPPVHSTEFKSFERHTKKQKQSLFFTKERLIIYGSGETILARLHLNFSYVLNFEVTLKRLREDWRVNSEDSHHDTTIHCN